MDDTTQPTDPKTDDKPVEATEALEQSEEPTSTPEVASETPETPAAPEASVEATPEVAPEIPVAPEDPVETTQEATAPEQTQQETTPTEAKGNDCECTTINEQEWDKQKKNFNKKFYKTYSPRILFFPFSMAIDINRAIMNAKKDGFTVPANPMLLDTGGMFWASVMIEVEGGDDTNKSVVKLEGEYYAKTSRRPWKEMKADMDELTKEFGSKPKELWMWYTACPKCIQNDPERVKTVFLAK